MSSIGLLESSEFTDVGNVSKKAYKRIIRSIIGAALIIFFIIYSLSMFCMPYVYDVDSEQNDDVFDLKKDKKTYCFSFLDNDCCSCFRNFLNCF